MTEQPIITFPEAYKSRAVLRIRISCLEQKLQIVEIDLTPPDGWPGKNAEQRQVERVITLNKFADYYLCKIELQAVRDSMEMLDAQIAGMEANRRDLEWSIRARLVDALSWNHITSDGGAAIETSAFEDVQDSQVDIALVDRVAEQMSTDQTKETPAVDEQASRRLPAPAARAGEPEESYHRTETETI